MQVDDDGGDDAVRKDGDESAAVMRVVESTALSSDSAPNTASLPSSSSTSASNSAPPPTSAASSSGGVSRRRSLLSVAIESARDMLPAGVVGGGGGGSGGGGSCGGNNSSVASSSGAVSPRPSCVGTVVPSPMASASPSPRPSALISGAPGNSEAAGPPPLSSSSSSAAAAAAAIYASQPGAALLPPLGPTEWRLPSARLVAFHDSASLAAGWCLVQPSSILDGRGPAGASAAASPGDDDPGDGKSNHLLASCPAFRNETGGEPVRRLSKWRQQHPLRDHHHLQQQQQQQQPPQQQHVEENPNQTWQREHTAAEAGLLEDVSNVYLGGRLCAARQSFVVIEPQDLGAYYFRHCFAGREHVCYVGLDEDFGPVAVSMVRELQQNEDPPAPSTQIYRVILRLSDLCMIRAAIPYEAVSDESHESKTMKNIVKELVYLICPKINFSSLRPALRSSKLEEMLMKIDEQPIYTRYKVGVLLCREGQSTEEHMYNNELSTPAFDEFLDFLGRRVRLKGFDRYKGGLDVRGDTTGTHSIFYEHHAHQIMFHVATMLPFTPSNRQQLSRKRHIGNDMVSIVFQEPGALPFSPLAVRSHFQHVFIVIRVYNPCTDNVCYQVAVSRAREVPSFGPPLPPRATFQKSADFHEWLITKIINAENAVHRSSKFASMAARTRREALKELVEHHAAPAPAVDPATRIASRLLGGSVKRREKEKAEAAASAAAAAVRERTAPSRVLVQAANGLRGALSWHVDVRDHSTKKTVPCILGLSYEWLVLVERLSAAVLFATPTHSVIGWACTDFALRIWYDHGEVLTLRCAGGDASDQEQAALLQRLQVVSKGAEARELLVRARRAPHESLGVHVQEEGIVSDVEMYSPAWTAGLRQGSRIVEIESREVGAGQWGDELPTLLATTGPLRLLVIPPAADGAPRRGCEDPHCPAATGLLCPSSSSMMLLDDEQLPDGGVFTRPPAISYEELWSSAGVESIPSPSCGSPSTSFEMPPSANATTSPDAVFSPSGQEAAGSMMGARGSRTSSGSNASWRAVHATNSDASQQSAGSSNTSGTAVATGAAGTATTATAAAGAAANPPRMHFRKKTQHHHHHSGTSPTRRHRLNATNRMDGLLRAQSAELLSGAAAAAIMSSTGDPVGAGGPSRSAASWVASPSSATAGYGRAEISALRAQMARCQAEKRVLHAALQQATAKLQMERRAHEQTKLELSRLRNDGGQNQSSQGSGNKDTAPAKSSD